MPFFAKHGIFLAVAAIACTVEAVPVEPRQASSASVSVPAATVITLRLPQIIDIPDVNSTGPTRTVYAPYTGTARPTGGPNATLLNYFTETATLAGYFDPSNQLSTITVTDAGADLVIVEPSRFIAVEYVTTAGSTQTLVTNCTLSNNTAACAFGNYGTNPAAPSFTAYTTQTYNMTTVLQTVYPLSVAAPVSDASAIRSVYTQLGGTVATAAPTSSSS